jgi:hypothetical protein
MAAVRQTPDLEEPSQAPPPDRTQLAVQHFAREARSIQGVLRVETPDGSVPADHALLVYVERGNRVAENGVYQLEMEMYRRYPGARLEVHLDEE